MKNRIAPLLVLAVLGFLLVAGIARHGLAQKDGPRTTVSRLLVNDGNSDKMKLAYDFDTVDERTLLEYRVAVKRDVFEAIEGLYNSGSPHGSRVRLLTAKAEMFEAEAELYAFTGERDKWLEAIRNEVRVREEFLKNIVGQWEFGTAGHIDVAGAETALLDAQLKYKRAQAGKP